MAKHRLPLVGDLKNILNLKSKLQVRITSSENPRKGN